MTDPTPADAPSSAGLLASAFGHLLNRVIALDARAPAQLRALAGRSVVLQLQQPALALAVRIDDQGLARVELAAAAGTGPVPPDLQVRTSPGALLRLLASGSAGIGQLRVEGDAELARQLEQLARGWRPDLDELFSRGFGDVLGFQLARAARGLGGWLRQGARRVAEQGAEYLREESRDLVAPGELDRFLDQVDDLRDAVERAERRLQRLQQRRGTGQVRA